MEIMRQYKNIGLNHLKRVKYSNLKVKNWEYMMELSIIQSAKERGLKSK